MCGKQTKENLPLTKTEELSKGIEIRHNLKTFWLHGSLDQSMENSEHATFY